MKNLSIINPNTKDIVGTAKYDPDLKSGQVITYEDEDGFRYEGIVSFAEKWNADKYHAVKIVYIVK
jgi:hypothetical protein